jgi:hypothetical protein
MLLEIKSPEYMYSEIKFIKNNTIAFPQECNPEKRHLVKENHFDQMQMEIAVFGKKGIHYFVDAVKEESSHHVVELLEMCIFPTRQDNQSGTEKDAQGK